MKKITSRSLSKKKTEKENGERIMQQQTRMLQQMMSFFGGAGGRGGGGGNNNGGGGGGGRKGDKSNKGGKLSSAEQKQKEFFDLCETDDADLLLAHLLEEPSLINARDSDDLMPPLEVAAGCEMFQNYEFLKIQNSKIFFLFPTVLPRGAVSMRARASMYWLSTATRWMSVTRMGARHSSMRLPGARPTPSRCC